MAILLGTSFIDSFIKRFFRLKTRLLPMHSKPIAMFDSASTLKSITAVSEGSEQSEETTEDVKGSTLPIQVAQDHHIPPICTAKLLVNSSAPGLSYLSTNPNLVKCWLYLVSQGLVDNVVGRPFHVPVLNFG